MASLCSVECRAGYFCDHGTRACETCSSICDPLRNTMPDCLATIECKGAWNSTATTPSLVNTTSGPAPDIDILLAILCALAAVVLILAPLTFFLLRRRCQRGRTVSSSSRGSDRCWPSSPKSPIPVSHEEDAKDRAAAAADRNGQTALLSCRQQPLRNQSQTTDGETEALKTEWP